MTHTASRPSTVSRVIVALACLPAAVTAFLGILIGEHPRLGP